ncbi:DNA-directed DNA polymerase eta rad30 [Tulasnella sp. 403]|nr:DNA-directed DNA polymerase eta rad30 [Tulasnella sp. 403]
MSTPAFSRKGKERALEVAEEITPVITYRHLLTNKLGVMDPLRVIALCDLDAFYASAERVRLGVDPCKDAARSYDTWSDDAPPRREATPLAVQQWDGLIAVNYPARKFGISRMETVSEAKKKCPELVLVHVATYKEGEAEAGYWENPRVETHKVSLDYYRRESMKILNVHRECMHPGVEVEKASIDEAFFDFTIPVKQTILQRYPYLAQAPEDSPLGMDTPLPPPPPIDWDGKGNLVPTVATDTPSPTLGDASNPNEPQASEAVHPENEQVTHTPTWHDVALSIASEFMMVSRTEIKHRLGYTTSAGLARNKMLAKLVASYKKYDQQQKFVKSILRNEAIPGFLRPMPFQKIRFLGGKLGETIADELGATTVGDALDASLEEIQRRFGEESIWVYNILRGIDYSEVKERIATKSMQASKNLRPNATKLSEVTHWLRVLSSELSIRLLEAREHSSTLWPKTLVLHFKQVGEATRSKQAPFPFSKIITPDLILKPAEKLFKELMGGASFKIINISLAFAGLDSLETGQTGIEGFLSASTDPAVLKARSETPTGNLGKRKRVIDVDDEPMPEAHGDTSREVPATSFRCSRCNKAIPFSKAIMRLDSEARATAIEKMKAEHADFHVAQDVAREVVELSSDVEEIVVEKKKSTKSKAKQKEAKGIAKYFTVAPTGKKR